MVGSLPVMSGEIRRLCHSASGGFRAPRFDLRGRRNFLLIINSQQ
jgi:hypothetical protein